MIGSPSVVGDTSTSSAPSSRCSARQSQPSWGSSQLTPWARMYSPHEKRSSRLAKPGTSRPLRLDSASSSRKESRYSGGSSPSGTPTKLGVGPGTGASSSSVSGAGVDDGAWTETDGEASPSSGPPPKAPMHPATPSSSTTLSAAGTTSRARITGERDRRFESPPAVVLMTGSCRQESVPCTRRVTRSGSPCGEQAQGVLSDARRGRGVHGLRRGRRLDHDDDGLLARLGEPGALESPWGAAALEGEVLVALGGREPRVD